MMRRKDREVQSRSEIIDILKRCDTLTVALRGEETPYAVPVSFGIVEDGERLYVYFHGAKDGMKIRLIEKCPAVCVEGHIFHKIEPTPHGITTLYESIIGFGHAEKAEGDEIVRGLRSITEHYGYPEYPIDRCKGLSMTAVYRIALDQIFGKRNLPES